MSGSLTSMAQSSCSPSPVLIPRSIVPHTQHRRPFVVRHLFVAAVACQCCCCCRCCCTYETFAAIAHFTSPSSRPLWNVNCLSISLYNLFIASFIASSMTVIWFKAVLAPPHLLLFSSHAVYKSDKVKLTERYVVGSRSTGSCRGEGSGPSSAVAISVIANSMSENFIKMQLILKRNFH